MGNCSHIEVYDHIYEVLEYLSYDTYNRLSRLGVKVGISAFREKLTIFLINVRIVVIYWKDIRETSDVSDSDILSCLRHIDRSKTILPNIKEERYR